MVSSEAATGSFGWMPRGGPDLRDGHLPILQATI
jgi:hypothetical protein